MTSREQRMEAVEKAAGAGGPLFDPEFVRMRETVLGALEDPEDRARMLAVMREAEKEHNITLEPPGRPLKNNLHEDLSWVWWRSAVLDAMRDLGVVDAVLAALDRAKGEEEEDDNA